MDPHHEPGRDDAPVTVTQALDLLHRDGYVEDFDLVDGALSCGKHAPCPVRDVVVERVYRFEGPSDPGDMMIVLGVLDPVSQVRGTLAAAFGPLADPDLYDHLSDLSTRLT